MNSLGVMKLEAYEKVGNVLGDTLQLTTMSFLSQVF